MHFYKFHKLIALGNSTACIACFISRIWRIKCHYGMQNIVQMGRMGIVKFCDIGVLHQRIWVFV